MKETWKSVIIIMTGLLVVGGTLILAKNTQPAATAASGTAAQEKIIRFVRERFGVADNVTMTLDPLKPSIHPAFLQTNILSDNGKEKHSNGAFVTKDYRLLIIGNMYPAGSDPQTELVQHIREQFKIPAATNVKATPFKPSTYPVLLASTVTLEDGKQPPQSQEFFMTSDRKCLVVGSVFNMGIDPVLHARKVINTINQPTQGPTSAPVTIVEFADLQCPMCARMHEFLENELFPKYNGKVRVIYKEFPLPSIHDWTMVATVANECVYQIDPPAYIPFRSLVFKNQSSINATNVRDLVITYGEQVGVDRLRLAACIDSKASVPRIEEDFKEGQAVGVQSTPTSFINGKMIVGMPGNDIYFKAVEDALRGRK